MDRTGAVTAAVAAFARTHLGTELLDPRVGRADVATGPLGLRGGSVDVATGPLGLRGGSADVATGPLGLRGASADVATGPLDPRGGSVDVATGPLDPRGGSVDVATGPLDPRGRSDEGARVTRGPATPGSQSGHSETVCVALSGGPDSLALLACSLRAGLTVHAIVVDHNLQPGSADTARRAAGQAIALGATAEVVTVTVDGPGGMEAAARSARYDALDRARAGRPVLLGHTMDDQAETVLLGLARGSGARSLAGMRDWNAPWGRPLLGLRRSDTRGACAELGLDTFDDPHNHDPRFTRVRLRTEALPLLEDVLHGGVVPALARTAASLQADNDALDALATTAYAALRREVTTLRDPRGRSDEGVAAPLDPRGRSDDGAAAPLDPRGRSDEGAITLLDPRGRSEGRARVTRGPATQGSQPGPAPTLDAKAVATHPPAIRRRVIRLWLRDCGATDPTHPVITAVDALAADWHGQGGVAIGGDPHHRLEVVRTAGRLTLRRTPR